MMFSEAQVKYVFILNLYPSLNRNSDSSSISRHVTHFVRPRCFAFASVVLGDNFAFVTIFQVILVVYNFKCSSVCAIFILI